jgi:DNA-binding transcriptional LysR family regulator
VDGAVVNNPEQNPRLNFVLLGEHEIVWAAHPSFDVSKRVKPAELSALPIATTPPPSPQYLMIMDWFHRSQLVPSNLTLCTSATVIRELVTAGLAISLLPSPLVQRQVASGELVTLPARPAPKPVPLYFSYRRVDAGAKVDALLRGIQGVLERVPFLRAA